MSKNFEELCSINVCLVPGREGRPRTTRLCKCSSSTSTSQILKMWSSNLLLRSYANTMEVDFLSNNYHFIRAEVNEVFCREGKCGSRALWLSLFKKKTKSNSCFSFFHLNLLNIKELFFHPKSIITSLDLVATPVACSSDWWWEELNRSE